MNAVRPTPPVLPGKGTLLKALEHALGSEGEAREFLRMVLWDAGMADWNIPAHGRANTSHGCVNVGPVDAQWFYDNFNAGDVVEVKNSPRPLDLRNGLGDWLIPWSQW